MGYPGPEAARLLGLAEMPIALTSRVKINYVSGGPRPVELLVGLSVSKNYAQWTTWRGKPNTSLWLLGCYKTWQIVGNRVKRWAPYPVLCTVYEQRIIEPDKTFFVRRWDQTVEKRAAEDDPLSDWNWLIFAYAPARGWLHLGRVDNFSFQTAIGEPCPSCEETLAEHGAPLWSADWLARAYGFAMKPLPQGWEDAPDLTDETTYQWRLTLLEAAKENPDWW